MQLIIQNKEIAQLLSKSKNVNAISVSIIDDDFYMITPFEYDIDSRHDIVNSRIPKEVLDKIRTLLELGTDRFTAFELIIPYLEQDK